jgi:flagellar biosynthesis protein
MKKTNEQIVRKEAVALSYHPERDKAPIVVAKGKGKIADAILEKAKAHDIPIQEDRTLVSLLGQLQINETIPEQLFEAVAEVFAFVYRLDRQVEDRLIERKVAATPAGTARAEDPADELASRGG